MEPRHIPQGGNAAFHDRHTDKQHTKTQQDLAKVVQLPLFGKHKQAGTNGDRHIRQHRGFQDLHEQTAFHCTGTIQAQQLGCYSGADVSTHNDAHGLLQIHDACVDETHHHDSGGR